MRKFLVLMRYIKIRGYAPSYELVSLWLENLQHIDYVQLAAFTGVSLNYKENGL